MTDELSSYVELLTRQNVKKGMSEEEARRAAALQVGGVEQLKEQVRESRTGFAFETLLIDLRYGIRSLLKKPAFALTAIAALALGIGANTAMFSVIDGVLLRSLSYADPQRLVVLWEKNASLNRDRNVVSAANFFDWQKQSTSFENMVAVWDARANLTDHIGEPIEVKAQLVSEPFFRTLGVQPIVGRWFSADEDRAGNDLVVILSHRLWQNRFGADPAVIGKVANLSGRPRTIVGVMPPGFYFLDNEVDAWAPIAQNAAQFTRENSGRFLRSVARLKAGVTIPQAQAEMSAIASQLAQQYPEYNKGWDVNVMPIHEQIVRDIRPILLVLSAAVAFVLLIACANVANLLLARAAARQKEFALRAALGAGRLRLVRQMLTESVLLAVMGGAVGVVLAFWGVHALVALAPDNLPRLDEIRIDPPVLGFTFAIALFTGVFFGLFPAMQGSRVDLNDVLKEGARRSTGRRGRIFRNAFVVAEVAIALVLLIGAGLMIRSFMELHQVRSGFITDNVLAMRVQLPMAKYRAAINEKISSSRRRSGSPLYPV
jgi:putative ABC transport system permease protein